MQIERGAPCQNFGIARRELERTVEQPCCCGHVAHFESVLTCTQVTQRIIGLFGQVGGVLRRRLGMIAVEPKVRGQPELRLIETGIPVAGRSKTSDDHLVVGIVPRVDLGSHEIRPGVIRHFPHPAVQDSRGLIELEVPQIKAGQCFGNLGIRVSRAIKRLAQQPFGFGRLATSCQH